MAFTSVDTFDVDPEGPVDVEYSRRSVGTPRSTGVRLGRQVRTAASQYSEEVETRTWTLRWQNGTPDQRDAILTIFDNSLAGALPIDYTPPDVGSNVQVRILDSSIVEQWTQPQTYRMQVRLEEFI